MINKNNPKTEKGIKAKEKILCVVLGLINEKGYEKTTLNDICEMAEIANGTFYHYFKSKQDVMVEFLTRETDDLLRYYNSLELESPVDKLYKFLEYQFRYFDRKGKEFVSQVFLIELETRNKVFHLNDFVMNSIIRRCIDEGQEKDIINKGHDSGFISHLLTSSILYNSFMWISSERDLNFGSFAMPDIMKMIKLFT